MMHADMHVAQNAASQVACGTSGNANRPSGKQLSCANRVTETYAILFPNSLPAKQVILVKDSEKDVWRYASVVHARKRENCPPDLDNSLLTPEHYDYYVHFQGTDRRLDTWVTWPFINSIDNIPDDLKIDTCVEHPSDDDHAGMDEEYLQEHEENTKVKTIKRIKMDQYIVDAWYFSPYPKEYQNIDILYICHFCLSFFRYQSEIDRHSSLCQLKHPPGNEIYRDGKIAMFEVDGRCCRIYCENLCYLSKLFLDHKTLRHPVNLFLFYVMTEIEDTGYHITGYFSKEKYSKNNISCILTLPQHQRKGYGKFLINFSYCLSKKENKTGTPERPLSDLGKASYMAYWIESILEVVKNHEGPISINDISERTAIATADVITCLEENNLLKTIPGCEAFIFLTEEKVQTLTKLAGRATININIDNLHWTSYDRFLAPYEYNPQP